MQKNIWQNSTSIHDKNSYQSGDRGNISQNSKSYLWQTHCQYNTQWWKVESLSAKIWNKTRMPTLTTSIKHSYFSSLYSWILIIVYFVKLKVVFFDRVLCKFQMVLFNSTDIVWYFSDWINLYSLDYQCSLMIAVVSTWNVVSSCLFIQEGYFLICNCYLSLCSLPPIVLLFFNSSKHKDGLLNTDLMLSSQSAEQQLCEVSPVKKGIHPQIRIRMEIKIVLRYEQMRTRGIWGSGGEGIQVQLCPMKEEEGAGVASGDSSQVAIWPALPFVTKQV